MCPSPVALPSRVPTQSGHRGDTHNGNVLLEKLDGLGAEAGEEQRRFYGVDVGGGGYRDAAGWVGGVV